MPAPAAIICGKINAKCEPFLRCAQTQRTRAVAVKNRWSMRPLPGHPFGNVENKRCNKASLRNSLRTQNGRKDVRFSAFRGWLQFDDSTLQPDFHGMGPVVGSKFREDVANVALHTGFSDRELIGDLLVRIAISDEP